MEIIAKSQTDKVTLPLDKAIPFISEKLTNKTLIEVSWVTGKHHADPRYDVGYAISPSIFCDWTDRPGYYGSTFEERPDHFSELEWVLQNLPKEGLTTIIYYLE